MSWVKVQRQRTKNIRLSAESESAIGKTSSDTAAEKHTKIGNWKQVTPAAKQSARRRLRAVLVVNTI